MHGRIGGRKYRNAIKEVEKRTGKRSEECMDESIGGRK
jgi:hypothetical protein